MSNITALAPQPFAKLQENFKGMVNQSSFLQSLKDHKLKAVLDISDVEEQLLQFICLVFLLPSMEN